VWTAKRPMHIAHTGSSTVKVGSASRAFLKRFSLLSQAMTEIASDALLISQQHRRHAFHSQNLRTWYDIQFCDHFITCRGVGGDPNHFRIKIRHGFSAYGIVRAMIMNSRVGGNAITPVAVSIRDLSASPPRLSLAKALPHTVAGTCSCFIRSGQWLA
jgi:hypothetical protein